VADNTAAAGAADRETLSRAELETQNAQLVAENAALRARVGELNDQVAALAGKIADLEKLLGRNSSNSLTGSHVTVVADPFHAVRVADRCLTRSVDESRTRPSATAAARTTHCSRSARSC